MLRYPPSTQTCAHCKTRGAMFNDSLCGVCAEELEGRTKPGKCVVCGSPDGAYLQRSLAVHTVWIKAGLASESEPGFSRTRKNTVMPNGYCRVCFAARKAGDK